MSPDGDSTEEIVAAFMHDLDKMIAKAFGPIQIVEPVFDVFPQHHSPIAPNSTFHRSWLWFLQECLLARQKNSFYVMEAFSAMNPLLYGFEEELLFIKLLSLFDDALETYIRANRTRLSGNYQGRLHDRLEFLGRHGEIVYSQALRDLRHKRNAIAHQPTTATDWQSRRVTGQDLDSAITEVEVVLQHLGMIGPRPVYKPFAERNSIPVPPEKPDVVLVLKYELGIKENGNIIVRVSHSAEIYKM